MVALEDSQMLLDSLARLGSLTLVLLRILMIWNATPLPLFMILMTAAAML
jgi:hypothetical protein